MTRNRNFLWRKVIVSRRWQFILFVIMFASAAAWSQQPDLNQLPSYKPDYKVAGAVRIYGSDLKGQVIAWEQGFLKYHPDAVFSNSFHTSSEGAMAGLYAAGAFTVASSTAPPHSPPNPSPWPNRNNASNRGAVMPMDA